MISPPTRRLCLPLPLLVVLATLLALTGCAGSYTLARTERPGVPGVAWFTPETAGDRTVLARWWAGVGPPVVRTARVPDGESVDSLRVVSWNVALGTGDVPRFLRDLRAESPRDHVVLLLQEVYRGGPEVPATVTGGIRFAGRLGAGAAQRSEVEAIASAAGLNLYYVPSMRNGGPRDSDEDRGNAILSSLPLGDLAAVELPFERQRRVAVAATIEARSSNGQPWRLRVVSSHLDNMVGARRFWILGGEFARVRQARALVDYLRREQAVVLGGDFNTWFGFEERTYAELSREFPDTRVEDRRPTFMGLLRLDHLFFRLPDGWRGRFRRAAEKYGSDHYPLVATINLAG